MRFPESLVLIAVAGLALGTRVDCAPPVDATGDASIGDLACRVSGLEAQAGARYSLIGLTTANYTGAQGLIGFTLACQEEFPGTRFCSTQDVVETVQLPALAPGFAWVRPVIVAESNGAMRDFSGASGASNTMTCRTWLSSSSSDQGLVVRIDADGEPTGSIGSIQCDGMHSVACCAPVP